MRSALRASAWRKRRLPAEPPANRITIAAAGDLHVHESAAGRWRRSEESRGGKEGRSRWGPDHLKKKKKKESIRGSNTKKIQNTLSMKCAEKVYSLHSIHFTYLLCTTSLYDGTTHFTQPCSIIIRYR